MICRSECFRSGLIVNNNLYDFFFFKQKTAYEIYQCDWSSDVCSSDLEHSNRNFFNSFINRIFSIEKKDENPRSLKIVLAGDRKSVV